MDRRSELLQKISQRGDHYGNCGGLYSLLEWCGKNSLREVTEEEAQIFFETPDAAYPFLRSPCSDK